ncbi:MAG: cytochrome c peroxidase [Pyrinomonadaceae bacterium]
MRTIKLSIVVLFLFTAFVGFGKHFFNQTVSGQSSIAAPTGVIASDGSYSTKVGLTWDAIRGATTYRIFRNTTNSVETSVDVGTTSAPFFFDATAPQNQTFFYWIRAENGSAVSNFSAPDTGIRANGVIQGPVQPLNPPPVPAANQITATKAYLGKVLFWDEQMSSTRTVACGTCHTAGKGGSDARVVVGNTRSTNPGFDGVYQTPDDVYASPGVPLNNVDGTYSLSNFYGLKEQVTGRKSQSYINAGYSQLLFWDGRASNIFRDPITNAVVLNNNGALESQAIGPPVSSAEMAHQGRDWNAVAAQIAQSKPLALTPTVSPALQTWIDGRSYPELFEEAFGTTEVTPSRIALAIGTFERTLFSDRTPFDAAVSGIAPLTAQEQRGQNVFNQVQCNTCHTGTLFSDNAFHYIGLRPQTEDTGRFQVTANNQNLGEFRTPSLRNVELRGPYMHNGRFATLEEVVEFYNRGGDFNAPNKPPTVRPRNLSTQQKADLVAFLKRPLTDPRVTAQTAPFDRPVLYTESSRVPQISGTGRAGSGNIVPQVVAIEPPILGNPRFTVGLSNALGSSQAVLVINNQDPGIGTTIPASGSFARVSVNLGGSGAGNGFGSTSLVIPDDAALLGKTFFGRWYVTDASAANGFSVSQVFQFTIFGEATAPQRAEFADFDGDRKTDVSVFRPSEGNWYIFNSATDSASTTHFGLGGDLLTPADYDGDGKADIAVYRGGIWYLLRSRDGFFAYQFGLGGDIPQAGDYDGDGKDDLAVYRPSEGVWYILASRDGFSAFRFGLSADRPVANDYDGDGRTDVAIYRDGIWHVQRSRDGYISFQYGLAEDKPALGDYDGDGKADFAVFRPSTGIWYEWLSAKDTSFAVQFGITSDVPSPGDFDGDGKADPSVYRPSNGTWYALQSTNGAARIQHFGLSTDISVPFSIVP